MRDKKLVRAVLLITVVVTSLFLNVKLNFAQETKAPEPPKAEAPAAPGAVSYTHLTLPTIYSV